MACENSKQNQRSPGELQILKLDVYIYLKQNLFSVYLFCCYSSKKPVVPCENKQDICSMLGFCLCFSSGELCAHVWTGGIALPSLSQLGCKVAAIPISRALFL